MHEWPQVETLDVAQTLETWELHGIREWAYRTLLNDNYKHVPAYFGHRMLKTIEDRYQKRLWLASAEAEIYSNGDMYPLRFDPQSNFRTLSFFTALRGQSSYPLMTKFADRKEYYSDTVPTRQALLYDAGRILHGRSGGFHGERAVILKAGYTDTPWRALGYTATIQQGSELVHSHFEDPYASVVKNPDLVPYILDTVMSDLADYDLETATVREGDLNDVDHNIRKTGISWVPWIRFQPIAEALERAVTGTLPEVAPQFDSIDALIKPQLQYTVYKPGDFYDWHEDGNFHSFRGRRVSLTMMLQPAEEGGLLEIENYGEVPMEAGDIVIFPSYKRHRVTPCTKGERHTLVAWLEESQN